MSQGVEFEEDKFSLNNASRRGVNNPIGGSAFGYQTTGNVTGMTGWLLRKGIVKSEESAKIILIAIVVINIIITISIVFYFT